MGGVERYAGMGGAVRVDFGMGRWARWGRVCGGMFWPDACDPTLARSGSDPDGDLSGLVGMFLQDACDPSLARLGSHPSGTSNCRKVRTAPSSVRCATTFSREGRRRGAFLSRVLGTLSSRSGVS